MCYFSYTQDIWLHSYILKCLLHALSESKCKKFTPLHQFEVTGFIYGTKFSTIAVSASENPRLHVDCSSISHILRISYQTILANSLWDTSKNMENYSLLRISTIRLERAPFPLQQCWFLSETLGVIVHEKYFPLSHVLLPKSSIV